MSGKYLQVAHELINGERQQDYGYPGASFERIAELWTLYLDGRAELSREDVAVMMALLKISRLIGLWGKQPAGSVRDTYVDLLGYIALAADMRMGDEDEEA